jgi:hypothetical protein
MMDPEASVSVPVVAPAASTIGPKIFQLSHLQGNIFDIDCFYCGPLAVIAQGGFETFLAFAAVHCHPITIHDCPDITAF